MSVNVATIIGRVGQDIELKYTQNNFAYATMSVATDEGYVDKQGNKVEKTMWHNIAINGKTAENCSKYLHKGSLVYVSGPMESRKYTDKQGIERVAFGIKGFTVKFLDTKKASSDEEQDAPRENVQSHGQYQKPSQQQMNESSFVDSENMDEVPF